MAAELRALLQIVGSDPASRAWAQGMLEEVDRAEATQELSPDLTHTAEYQAGLERRRAEQVARLIKLGFHRELRMTPEKYVESLPPIDTQVHPDQRHFGPLIVDYRIPWRKQLELYAAEEPQRRRLIVEDLDMLDNFRNPDERYDQAGIILARTFRAGSVEDAHGKAITSGESLFSLTEAVATYVALGQEMAPDPLVAGSAFFLDGSVASVNNRGGLLRIVPLSPAGHLGLTFGSRMPHQFFE